MTHAVYALAALRSRPATGALTRARSETVPSLYSSPSTSPSRRAIATRSPRPAGSVTVTSSRHALNHRAIALRSRSSPRLRSAEIATVSDAVARRIASAGSRSTLFMTTIREAAAGPLGGGIEGFDQHVRQAMDEADGVGQHHRHLAGEPQAPNGRVEGRERAV